MFLYVTWIKAQNVNFLMLWFMENRVISNDQSNFKIFIMEQQTVIKCNLCHAYEKVPKRNYLVFRWHSKCIQFMVLHTSKWYSVSIEIFYSLLWWSLHQYFYSSARSVQWVFFFFFFCCIYWIKPHFLIYVHTKVSRGIRSSECNELKLTLQWSGNCLFRVWWTILLEHDIQFMLY
jgi:hypothetical protein